MGSPGERQGSRQPTTLGSRWEQQPPGGQGWQGLARDPIDTRDGESSENPREASCPCS